MGHGAPDHVVFHGQGVVLYRREHQREYHVGGLLDHGGDRSVADTALRAAAFDQIQVVIGNAGAVPFNDLRVIFDPGHIRAEEILRGQPGPGLQGLSGLSVPFALGDLVIVFNFQKVVLIRLALGQVESVQFLKAGIGVDPDRLRVQRGRLLPGRDIRTDEHTADDNGLDPGHLLDGVADEIGQLDKDAGAGAAGDGTDDHDRHVAGTAVVPDLPDPVDLVADHIKTAVLFRRYGSQSGNGTDLAGPLQHAPVDQELIDREPSLIFMVVLEEILYKPVVTDLDGFDIEFLETIQITDICVHTYEAYIFPVLRPQQPAEFTCDLRADSSDSDYKGRYSVHCHSVYSFLI